MTSLPKKISSVSDCSVQSRWDDQTCITSCASICNNTNQDFSCPEGWIYFYKLWIDKFVEIREKLTVLIPGLYSVCKGTVYLLKKVQIIIVAIGQTTLFTVALQMMKQILLPDLRRSYKIQRLTRSEQTVFIQFHFLTARNCFFGGGLKIISLKGLGPKIFFFNFWTHVRTLLKPNWFL